MKTRLKIIIVGIVLASVVFGTHQSLMTQCGTLPVFMETPRSPNLWNCLQIWENQSDQHNYPVGLIIPSAFGMCIINDDWSAAPCFDMGPITKSEFKMAWAPYYDYKGEQWMELKKTEMLQSLNDGFFDEWSKETENSNVYHYYVSIGDMQRQFEYDPMLFREETPAYYLEILILSTPIIAIGLIIIFVWKKRK